MRVKTKPVLMECSDCKNRNYRYWRSREAVKTRLELKKFCKFCQKHTLHRESK